MTQADLDRNEIIEMARRARLHRNQHNLASNPVQYKFSYDGTEEALIAFARLVADVATAKEREACANLCDELGEKGYVAEGCAKAIRARGQA